MASRRAFLCLKPPLRPVRYSQIRSFTITPLPAREKSSGTVPPVCGSQGIHPDELEQLLAEPTWSVESLLPPKTRTPDAPTITSQQLHHLLRLSALPPPETPEHEQQMLDTLAAQLHFVGKIQQVDTSGVKPLRAIRDETVAAEQELKVTQNTLKEALGREQVIGHHYKRIPKRHHASRRKRRRRLGCFGLGRAEDR